MNHAGKVAVYHVVVRDMSGKQHKLATCATRKSAAEYAGEIPGAVVRAAYVWPSYRDSLFDGGK